MKLQVHRSTTFRYILISEESAFRKVSIFEDFDENFISFFLNSKKKLRSIDYDEVLVTSSENESE